MIRGLSAWRGGALLAGAIILSGCAGPPIIDDPTGIAFVDSLLAFLANRNVAYLLLVLGLLAVVAEVSTPGAIMPGVVGALCLVLSLFGLLQLPTNWLGLLLILAGIVMMLVDMHVPGIALTVGGIIAFLIGSLLLFARPAAGPELSAAPVPQLSPLLVVATTSAVGLFFFLVVSAAVRAQRRPIAAGRETLIGQIAVVRQPLAPTGIVHVEGEQWTAQSVTGDAIGEGERVRVVGIDGLKLQVEPEASYERWSRRGSPGDPAALL